MLGSWFSAAASGDRFAPVNFRPTKIGDRGEALITSTTIIRSVLGIPLRKSALGKSHATAALVFPAGTHYIPRVAGIFLCMSVAALMVRRATACFASSLAGERNVTCDIGLFGSLPATSKPER